MSETSGGPEGFHSLRLYAIENTFSNEVTLVTIPSRTKGQPPTSDLTTLTTLSLSDPSPLL